MDRRSEGRYHTAEKEDRSLRRGPTSVRVGEGQPAQLRRMPCADTPCFGDVDMIIMAACLAFGFCAAVFLGDLFVGWSRWEL